MGGGTASILSIALDRRDVQTFGRNCSQRPIPLVGFDRYSPQWRLLLVPRAHKFTSDVYGAWKLGNERITVRFVAKPA